MKCLWITLADPDPATNGQLIYSKGLIEAACDAGASLTVIGLARPQTKRPLIDPSGIVWQLGREQPKSSWRRLISRDPRAAARVAPEMVQALEQALSEQSWEAIVLDSICAGWALDRVLRHRRQSERPPRIVYIAHNHEITVARRIARDARGLNRVLKEIDRMKVIKLERRFIASVDLLTSNTPDDCRLFATDRGNLPVAFLPPGYGGPRVAARIIDAAVPRRAILVGSLDWPPKRVSLETFLVAGAAILAKADVSLQIVGEVEMAYLEKLRRRFPSVEFVGPVANVQSYMAGARLALVPDMLGGFKLKGLDYAFNRLPIFAMRAGLPGMPLRDGHSAGLFDSHRALAEGVVGMIDDFPQLNAWHERAYAACADHFDWKRIGRELLAQIREPGSVRRQSGTADQKSDGASSPARLAAER